MRFSWVLLIAAACGGRVAQGGAQGGDDGPEPVVTAGDDAGMSQKPGDPQDIPVCPPDPPAAGSSCAMFTGQTCAYEVRQSEWTCVQFVCDSSGLWRSAKC